MHIGEIMTAASCVRFDEPAVATLHKMRNLGVDYAIVTREKEIIGVFSRAELATATADDASLTAGSVATPVPSLRPDAEIKEAAQVMRSRGVSCVPVTEGSTIAGIVTTDRLLELIERGSVYPRPSRERRILKDRGPNRKPGVSEAAKRLPQIKKKRPRPPGRRA